MSTAPMDGELLLGQIRWQRVSKQDPGDQTVKNQSHDERNHIKQGEVQEVDGHIQVPGHPIATANHDAVRINRLIGVHQEEPHDAVQRCEDPDAGDDLLGSRCGADELGFDGVADGDVALDGEGRDGAGGDIDSQILQVRDANTAGITVDPRRHNLRDVW